jgi:CRP-like cAMP-binding protein
MLMQTADHGTGCVNLLLRQLSKADRDLVDPGLRRVTFERDAPLFSANDDMDAVYFPESALVSLERGSGEDDRIETGLVGREGMVGWSALIGCRRSSYRAVVHMRAGTTLRISIEDLLMACASSSTLFAAMMRFVETVVVQMAEAFCSQRRDTVERRVSRWLLMRHDRVTGNEIWAKHDEIGAHLGVRRASITDCLHILEGEHLVRCHRGRIIIRDRARLEGLAAESYGAAEESYRALIGPFGKAADVAT